MKPLWEEIQQKSGEELAERIEGHSRLLSDMKKSRTSPVTKKVEESKVRDSTDTIFLAFNYGYRMNDSYSPSTITSTQSVDFYLTLADPSINENSLVETVEFRINSPSKYRIIKSAPFGSTIRINDSAVGNIKITWKRWTKHLPQQFEFPVSAVVGQHEGQARVEVRKRKAKFIIQKEY